MKKAMIGGCLILFAAYGVVSMVNGLFGFGRGGGSGSGASSGSTSAANTSNLVEVKIEKDQLLVDGRALEAQDIVKQAKKNNSQVTIVRHESAEAQAREKLVKALLDNGVPYQIK